MKLKTLVQSSQAGDKSAQRKLFEDTCDRLNSVALRYVLDASLAQDVLQEAYIRIFKGLSKFEYQDDVSTLAWMKRITVTECLRLIKKRKRWMLTDNASVQHHMEEAYDPVNDDIVRALLSLSPKARLVFNMYAIEGYSHKEIAEKLLSLIHI